MMAGGNWGKMELFFDGGFTAVDKNGGFDRIGEMEIGGGGFDELGPEKLPD
jgi:hypothetical protein